MQPIVKMHWATGDLRERRVAYSCSFHQSGLLRQCSCRADSSSGQPWLLHEGKNVKSNTNTPQTCSSETHIINIEYIAQRQALALHPPPTIETSSTMPVTCTTLQNWLVFCARSCSVCSGVPLVKFWCVPVALRTWGDENGSRPCG